jgi:ABC-type Mn2+/Zn2+ transport system permease subunit
MLFPDCTNRRKFSMTGDGLDHVSFGAVGCRLLLNLHPVYRIIPIVMLASLWIVRLLDKTGVQGMRPSS